MFNLLKFLKDLDDAVLRRFTKRIYVRLPCTADRSSLVQQLLGQQYNELSEREVLLSPVNSLFFFFFSLQSGISHLMSKCTRTWWHDFSLSRLTSLCCVQMHQIAQLTSGYSGSDLAALARDAAYGPIRCQPHLPANIFLFLLLQRAEDRRGEVFGPCEPEEDQHERLPRSHETDKKVRGHIVHWRNHSSSLFPRSVSADSLVPYEAWNQKFGEGAT